MMEAFGHSDLAHYSRVRSPLYTVNHFDIANCTHPQNLLICLLGGSLYIVGAFDVHGEIYEVELEQEEHATE